MPPDGPETSELLPDLIQIRKTVTNSHQAGRYPRPLLDLCKIFVHHLGAGRLDPFFLDHDERRNYHCPDLGIPLLKV